MHDIASAAFRGLLVLSAILSPLVPVSATPLDPDEFVSLGTWSVSSGNYTIDTDALTIVDDAAPGVPLFSGVLDNQGGAADSFGPGAAVTTVGASGIPHIAVFTFDQLTIEGSANITVMGHRALGLLSHGDILIDRTIDLSGGNAGDGGPGGFDGGAADITTATNGIGPGAGGPFIRMASLQTAEGGCAGFGSAGVPVDLGGPGSPGLPYGDLTQLLQGGSGGGGATIQNFAGASIHGAGGGGALEISARGFVELGAGGVLRADGGPVQAIPFALGGQGSGGGIRVTGREVVLDGQVSARGTDYLSAGVHYSGGGRVFLDGWGLFIAGQPFDGSFLESAIDLRSTDNAIGEHGVLNVIPSQTFIPPSQSLEIANQNVQAASTTAPAIELAIGEILAQGTLMVPAGGTTHDYDVILGSISARISGADPLTVAASLSGTGTAEVPVTIAAGGSLDLTNDIIIFPGDGNAASDDGLVNLGTMNLINSTINGDVRSPAGTTVNVAGTAVFNGLFKGGAGFSGTGNEVVFNGGYEPGDSPAAVDFGGGLTLGSGNVLRMELGGPAPGAGHDQIVVAAHLALGGTLELSYLPPYLPAGGQVFDLFDFGSSSGSFAALNLPALPAGQTWDTSQLYTEGIIAVVGSTTFGSEHPGLSVDGDENGNGISNYAEYAQGFDPSTTNTPLPGPSLSDGAQLSLQLRSDAADVFATWVTSPSLEPGSWTPLVQGVDYVLLQINEFGVRQEIVLQLLPGEPASRRFFRIEFNETP